MYFWVTFKNRSPGTIEGDGNWYPTHAEIIELRGSSKEEIEAAHEVRRGAVLADVRRRAEVFGEVVSIDTLPYPAEPVLDMRSNCPPFCWNPNGCKGRTSCPRPRACDD